MPLRAVPRGTPLCREIREGSMIRAVWGPGWTRLPRRAREVLPQRGDGHRPLVARRPIPGSATAIMAPSRGSLGKAGLQGDSGGVHDSRPLGAGMDASACVCLYSFAGEVLPQRGMAIAHHHSGGHVGGGFPEGTSPAGA